jgi:alkylation response protein AidB-like acyl-CoA dehydrogenase
MPDEFRAEIRSVTRQALRGLPGSADQDQATPGAVGTIQALRQALVELGALGLEIPESDGGTGRTFADACAVIGEAGHLVLPSPAVSLLALGVGATLLDHDPDRRREDRKFLSSGTKGITAALTGPDGTLGRVCVDAVPRGTGFVLRGTAGFVPDADSSDVIAVAARLPGAAEADCLFYAPPSAPGLDWKHLPTVDPAQCFRTLTFDEVPVQQSDALAPPGEGRAAVTHLLNRAAVAVAADSLGSAERVLELTVAHLRTREQFGRVIGSFQALKHRCANMYVWLRCARAAVEHAALVINDPRQASAAASIAKSYCGQTCCTIAEEGVQMHGAVAFTTEHEMHLHLKRQQLDAAVFGDPLWHRQRIAQLAIPATDCQATG